MKIEYYASSHNMGDTAEHDCEKFRQWAKAQIEAEYPEHDIAVLNQENLNTCWTSDEARADEINDFCSRLWDRCPWDWELADA